MGAAIASTVLTDHGDRFLRNLYAWRQWGGSARVEQLNSVELRRGAKRWQQMRNLDTGHRACRIGQEGCGYQQDQYGDHSEKLSRSHTAAPFP